MKLIILLLIKIVIPMNFLIWVLITPEVSDWWTMLSIIIMTNSTVEEK